MRIEKSFFLILFLYYATLLTAQNPDALYQKFSLGYDSLDAKMIADLYTEDAEVMYLYDNSNPSSFKGRPAILASFEDFFGYMKKENRVLKLVFKVFNREQIGEHILDNAYYQMTIQIPNQPDFVDYGKISTVLQVADGVWKFKTDASTTATKEEFDKAVALQSIKE